MKKLLASAAAAALVASPAFAGALIFEPEPEPVVAVAPAPASAPLPTWTGPYVGAHVGWGDVELDTPVGDFDDDGVTYGVQAGYDYDFGSGFVLGGGLSYSQLDAEPGGAEIDHLVRLTARGGYSLGQTLLYVKGGGFWADAEDADDYGWVAGAGIEHLITNNVSAGIEYLYHEADDFDDSGIDVTVQTVTLGINYRF